MVVTEDFTKDQYIRPIVEALFQNAGISNARVVTCIDPRLRGVSDAMKLEKLQRIVAQYSMVDVFLLIVDRDGLPGRRIALNDLEGRIEPSLRPGQRFLSENAWQEVEVWILAGHDLSEPWAEVRADPNPKERYFEPFAARRGLLDSPGGGRKILAKEAAGRIRRLIQLCPEDVGALRERL